MPIVTDWSFNATSPSTVKPSVVIVPVLLILPVPIMSLEFKSKSPPSCGVVSSTTSLVAATVVST